MIPATISSQPSHVLSFTSATTRGPPRWALDALGLGDERQDDAPHVVREVVGDDPECAVAAQLLVGVSISSLAFMRSDGDVQFDPRACADEYLKRPDFAITSAERMTVPPDFRLEQAEKLVARMYIAQVLEETERGYVLHLPDEDPIFMGEDFDEVIELFKHSYPVVAAADTLTRCYIGFDGEQAWIERCRTAAPKDPRLELAIDALAEELKECNQMRRGGRVYCDSGWRDHPVRARGTNFARVDG